MKHALLVASVMLVLAGRAYALVPVEDIPVLGQMITSVQQGMQILNEAKSTVGALTNIPREAIGRIESLLDQNIGSELRGITGNLNTLMTGQGSGTCSGASGLRAMQQYQNAEGGDFMGSSINGSAARLAGLQACTQQMLADQQDRIDKLPAMLDELKACNDVACSSGVMNMLEYENAMQSAQGAQATMIGWNAQLQRWTAEDQIVQKARSDEQQFIQSSGGNTGGIGGTLAPPTQTVAPNFGMTSQGAGG